MEICIWRLADGREAEGEEDWRQRAELVIPAMAQFQAGMLDYLLAPTGARLHLLIVPMKVGTGRGQLNGFYWPRSMAWRTLGC
jgi:hypothetical protein